jgi:hypothetical protein
MQTLEVKNIADSIIKKKYTRNIAVALNKGVGIYEYGKLSVTVALDNPKKEYCVDLEYDTYNIETKSTLSTIQSSTRHANALSDYAEYKNIPLILKALDAYADALPDNKLITPENINRLERIIDAVASFPEDQFCLLYTGRRSKRKNDIVNVEKDGKIDVVFKNNTEDNVYEIWDCIHDRSSWTESSLLDKSDINKIKLFKDYINKTFANKDFDKISTDWLQNNLYNADKSANSELTYYIKKMHTINDLISFIDVNELIVDAYKRSYAHNKTTSELFHNIKDALDFYNPNAPQSQQQPNQLSKVLGEIKSLPKNIKEKEICGIITVPKTNLLLKWRVTPSVLNFEFSVSCDELNSIVNAVININNQLPFPIIIKNDRSIDDASQRFFIKISEIQPLRFSNAHYNALKSDILSNSLLFNAIIATGDVDATIKEMKLLLTESVHKTIQNIIDNYNINDVVVRDNRTGLNKVREYNRIMKGLRRSILKLEEEYKGFREVNFRETVQIDKYKIEVYYTKFSPFLDNKPEIKITANDSSSCNLKLVATKNDFTGFYESFFGNVSMSQFKNAIEQLERQIYTRLVSDKEEAADVLKEHYPEEVIEYALNSAMAN